MIAKRYRLNEKEVKKVLQRWKPFFSYGIVVNSSRNTVWCNRFAIVIGSKSVNTNVTRVFFRRKFYNIVAQSSLFTDNEKWVDYIFVVKKTCALDRKDKKAISLFDKDLSFLIKKVK